MQPPPYPQPAQPPPMPPGRRNNRPLVLGLAAGAILLGALAVAIALLLSDQSADGAGGASGQGFQLRRVLSVTEAACPAGDSGQVSSVRADACYRLGDGMSVAQVREVRLVPPDASQGTTGYSIEIGLRPADAGRLSTLTTSVAAQPPPGNQLAVVVDGKVASAPTVTEPITGGALVLSGDFSRTEAQHYVDLFRG